MIETLNRHIKAEKLCRFREKEYIMNKKYSVDFMKQLAKERDFRFLSKIYTSCSKNHKWQCMKCDHVWYATPSNIKNKKSGCPQCAGRCKNKTDMHQLAKLNGINFISKSYKGMKIKHKWKCQSGHEWLAVPDHIKNGTKCPQCHSHVNEEKCRFILESMTREKFPSNWIKLGNGMQLDGYCKVLNIAFEYNGKQHYEQCSFFHKNMAHFESQKTRDKIKSDLCESKNINKITIPYFCAETDDQLELFIRQYLEIMNIEIYPVNWDQFIGKPSRLNKLKELAKSRNMKCLSKIYVNARQKLIFQCIICNKKWSASPYNIKTGHGCPRCGYVKRVKSRRQTILRKKKETIS